MLNRHTILLGDLTLEKFLELVEKYRHEKRIITLHPNGFLQLPLSDQGAKRTAKYQLHIWAKDIERRCEKKI